MAVAHPEPYTIDELYALPANGMRHELYDGALLVTPPPAIRHGLVLARLRAILGPALPPATVALENVGLMLNPARLFVPDLIVVPLAVAAGGGLYVTADDVLLVVEVESPSSTGLDRTAKPAMYAEAGIPVYLRIVPDGPHGSEAYAYRLSIDSPGTYLPAHAAHAGQQVVLPPPVSVAFDPAQLAR